jgi:hypothetical protein
MSIAQTMGALFLRKKRVLNSDAIVSGCDRIVDSTRFVLLVRRLQILACV